MIAFNPSRINVGSVANLEVEDEVVISPLYTVFQTDETLNAKFLTYFLKSNLGNQQIRSLTSGSVRDTLKYSSLEKILIPSISVQEQNNLVKQLDLLTKLIELREEEIEQLDELIKSRFVELFGEPEHNIKGWKIIKMEKLCGVSSSKRIYQNEQSMTGIPFLRISDLVSRMDTGSKECDLYIPEDRFEELKEQGLVPKAGDILVTARGTLGRCYIIAEDDEFYFQDGMITWLSEFQDEITPLYTSYLFTMPGFRKQIDSLQAGSTVAYLSISMTKKLDIMVPTLDLQNQFASFVQVIDKLKVEVKRALDETQILFDSLMHQYFE